MAVIYRNMSGRHCLPRQAGTLLIFPVELQPLQGQQRGRFLLCILRNVFFD